MPDRADLLSVGTADAPSRPAAPPPGAQPSLEDRLSEVERQRSVDVEQRLAEARELERLTGPTGGVPHQRARLVVGDMLHRVGQVADGAQLAAEVQAWAQAHREQALQARAHLVLSSVYDGIGDVPAALDHAVRSMDLLDDGTALRDRGVHLLRLADACAVTGSTDQARARYREAEEVFASVGDRDLRLVVLNNLTVLEYETGDVPAAVTAAERLRRLCTQADLNADFADTLGQAYLAAGRYPEALQVLAEGERSRAEQGASMPSTPAELALTRAQVLLASGALQAAAVEADRALAVCAARGLDGLRVRSLRVRSEVLAAAGEFEAAYHAHREFYAEAERLRSQQQDAAARTRQALFETAEARREADRFRAQARTDPLTGLPNRRHVDEQLPRLLAEAAETGTVLVAAVVDVDHFKQINDGYSHDVGDEVLQLLAGLLAAAVESGPAPAVDGAGFAARLGGEEFLVVRQAGSVPEAAAAVERLRAAVEAHPWAQVAAGLRVTVSAGVAVARPEDTQRSLLRRADGHLYDAKAAGRNRVRTDPPQTQR